MCVGLRCSVDGERFVPAHSPVCVGLSLPIFCPILRHVAFDGAVRVSDFLTPLKYLSITVEGIHTNKRKTPVTCCYCAVISKAQSVCCQMSEIPTPSNVVAVKLAPFDDFASAMSAVNVDMFRAAI